MLAESQEREKAEGLASTECLLGTGAYESGVGDRRQV